MYCGTLILNPGDMQLEPLFTIRALKQTSGLAHFQSQILPNIFNFISNFQVVHLSLRIN